MATNYYLLEFDCDNSIDIVEATSVIFDGGEFAEVGAKVEAVYSFGKKEKLFEAKVLNRSDDHRALKEEMEQMLADETDETELGRGKRMKRKKAEFMTDEEPMGEELKKPKRIKSKLQLQKEQKAIQQRQTAKELFQQIKESELEAKGHQEPSTSFYNTMLAENVALKEENNKLKVENKRLRRERAEALDTNRLLQTAVKLVDGLRAITPSRETPPPISSFSGASYSKPFSPLAKTTSTIVSSQPSLSTSLSPITITCSNSLFSPISTPSLSPSSNILTTAAVASFHIDSPTAEDESESLNPSTPPPPAIHSILPVETQPNQSDEQETAVGLQEEIRPQEEKSHQLLFRGTEENAVRLVQNKNIFVLKSAKEGLERYSKNQSTAVRSGLKAVFTEEALLTCSVKGGVAKGIGKPQEKRDALHPEGVSAIIEFSKQVAMKKGWTPLPDQILVSAMGTKLSEMRAAAAKKST